MRATQREQASRRAALRGEGLGELAESPLARGRRGERGTGGGGEREGLERSHGALLVRPPHFWLGLRLRPTARCTSGEASGQGLLSGRDWLKLLT
jgi:hypothetical protein